jgi:hypothetical protein
MLANKKHLPFLLFLLFMLGIGYFLVPVKSKKMKEGYFSRSGIYPFQQLLQK